MNWLMKCKNVFHADGSLNGVRYDVFHNGTLVLPDAYHWDAADFIRKNKFKSERAFADENGPKIVEIFEGKGR